MRTSRIQSSTTSLYRPSRMMVSPEAAFQDVYSQNGGQQGQHSSSKQNRNKQQIKKRTALKTMKGRIITKGIQLTGETTHIHNYLKYRSTMVNNVNKMRTRNHTYRTSI